MHIVERGVRLSNGHWPDFRTGKLRGNDHFYHAAQFILNSLEVSVVPFNFKNYILMVPMSKFISQNE